MSAHSPEFREQWEAEQAAAAGVKSWLDINLVTRCFLDIEYRRLTSDSDPRQGGMATRAERGETRTGRRPATAQSVVKRQIPQVVVNEWADPEWSAGWDTGEWN